MATCILRGLVTWAQRLLEEWRPDPQGRAGCVYVCTGAGGPAAAHCPTLHPSLPATVAVHALPTPSPCMGPQELHTRSSGPLVLGCGLGVRINRQAA